MAGGDAKPLHQAATLRSVRPDGGRTGLRGRLFAGEDEAQKVSGGALGLTLQNPRSRQGQERMGS